MYNLNVIVVLEFISRVEGPIPATFNMFLLKIPKFSFLSTHEAEIRP